MGRNDGFEALLDQYFLYRLSRYLRFYIPPVLFICGVIGNMLAFVVLTRQSMRGVSAYIYLIVLSITDTVVLVIGLLRRWVGDVIGYEVSSHASWVCKLIRVAGYTASDCSVWLIVAVTTARFIAVAWPLSALNDASSSGGNRRAVVVIVMLFITFFSTNAHFFWTVEVVYVFDKNGTGANNTSYSRCVITEGYNTLVSIAWPWVDAVLYSFVPLLLLSLLNSLIICNVFRASQRRVSLLAGRTAKSPQIQVTSARESSTNAADSGVRLTVMLLAVSFTFLATTLPNAIVLILTNVFVDRTTMSHQSIAFYVLAQVVGELLMYANHSVNFYLYCATGRKFRYQLMQVFSLSSRRKKSNYETSIVSVGSKNATKQQHLQGETTYLSTVSLANGSRCAHSRTPSPRRQRDLSAKDLNNAEVTLLLTDMHKITCTDSDP